MDINSSSFVDIYSMRTYHILFLIYQISQTISTKSLTCQGTAFDKQGVFCYEQKRDIDMLVDSFLELGLDAQAMLASRPAQIVRIVVATPAPTTTTTTRTTTTASTTKVTTTTTTLPPNRRRVQAGWPASGAAPCEDMNPSDAADSDCYATRYAVFKDDMYTKLQTMSVAVQTTGTYSDKLGSYIYSVSVPQFQDSLALSLQQGVPILDSATSGALTDVQTSINSAPTDTQTYSSSLDLASNVTRSSLRSKIQSAFDSLTALSIQNINALVKRSNDRNSVLAASPYSATLKWTNGNGSATVTNDENTMLGLVNKLTLLQNTVGTTLFYSQSNLSAVTLPQLLTNGSIWVKNKQAYMNSTLGALVSRITLSNISGIVNQTDAGINTTLTGAENDANSTVSLKSSNSGSQINGLNSLIYSASSGINSTFSTLQSSVSSAQANVQSGSFAPYNPMQNSLQKLLDFLNIFGADYVSGWESSAVDRLTRLKGYVASYSSQLQSNATQAVGNGTNGIQSSVLASLATLGSIQNDINSQILSRQSSALSQVQSLVNRANGNAVMFTQLLTNVTRAIATLRQASSQTANPLTLLGNITSGMDKLALAVNQLVQDTNGAISSASNSVSSRLDQYNSYVRSWWANQTAGGFATVLQGNVGSVISTENGRLDNTSQSIDFTSGSLGGSTSGAVSNVQTATSQLFENSQKTYQVISNTLSQVSVQAALGIRNFTTALTSFKNGLNSLWVSSAASAVGSTTGLPQASDLDRVVDSLTKSVKQAVDGFTDSTQSQILDPATQIATLIPQLSSDITFNATAAVAELSLNRSLSLVDTTVNNLISTDLESTVKTALSEGSSKGNDLTAEIMRIKNQLSQDSGSTAQLFAGLDSVASNLHSLAIAANSSGANSAMSLLAILDAGININGLLAAEIGYLSGGIAEAATGLNSSITEIGKSLRPDLMISNWSSESDARVATNWTSAIVTPLTAALNTAFSRGISEIRTRSSVIRPSEDQRMRTKISALSQDAVGLIEDLRGSGTVASSKTDLFMTSMNKSINAIQTKMGAVGPNPLPALQGVLDTVAETVGYATQGAGGKLVRISTGTVGGILDSSSQASTNFDRLSATANTAIATASTSVADGLKSVGMISSIIDSNENERANSAVGVVNQITESKNKVDRMIQSALVDSIDNSTNSSSWMISDFPAFIQGVDGQLATWNSFSAGSKTALSNFHRVNSDGVEGEELVLENGLRDGGNKVTESVIGLNDMLSRAEVLQTDLDDRLYSLNEFEDSLEVALGVKPSSTDVSTEGITSLGLSSSQVANRITSEQSIMRATEQDIDALLAKVR
jgi:hypothetical protein